MLGTALNAIGGGNLLYKAGKGVGTVVGAVKSGAGQFLKNPASYIKSASPLVKGVGVGALVGLGTGLAADAVGTDTKTGAALDVVSDAANYASAGAAIGSIIPGVGTVAGGVFGGIVGTAVGLKRNWGTLSTTDKDKEDEIVKNFSEVDLSMNDPKAFKEYTEYKKKRTEELSKEKPKDEAEKIAKREAILKFAPKTDKNKTDLKKAESDKKDIKPEEIKTVEKTESKASDNISDMGQIKVAGAGKVQQLDTKQVKEVQADRAVQLEKSQDELDRIVAEKQQQKTQSSESGQQVVMNNNKTTIQPSRQMTKNDDFSFNRYIDKSFFA